MQSRVKISRLILSGVGHISLPLVARREPTDVRNSTTQKIGVNRHIGRENTDWRSSACSAAGGSVSETNQQRTYFTQCPKRLSATNKVIYQDRTRELSKQSPAKSPYAQELCPSLGYCGLLVVRSIRRFAFISQKRWVHIMEALRTIHHFRPLLQSASETSLAIPFRPSSCLDLKCSLS